MREHHPPLGRQVRQRPIPKPGGGTRRLTLLGPREAEAYARAVARARPEIERRLGPEVFTDRRQRGRPEPWKAARARWRRAAAALIDGGPVATLDVARCFDSIGHDAVGEGLGRLSVSGAAVEDIVRILRTFAGAGVEGLPAGPAPSGVLANAVLAAVDEELRVEGVRFVRWVDDVIVSARGPSALGRGELAVERALSRIGLASNPAKHRRFADQGRAWSWILAGRAGYALEILTEP